ncbi:glycosyltransferase [Alkalinema sp. FACHB-956]|uniref:glycosyltransferase family 2 protein n=1 Tax=Alkalinema sp. FACHB-956 TaxID=2692768 RepID=UPI0016888586|nr:glycosyltransferase [Alkalinema sp. FACHB-956]MBD2327264.1 glycosyltransferase [Alkalinema sp. FACHB-956]
MAEALPRVSIGVPVYNGEAFLRDCLDSLLGQTFSDFEIIISDNASTDSTEAICREYAARDARIYYYRNDYNIGPVANFDRVLRLARGEYFKWAAHDDVSAPEWLARCVEVLEHHPEVALCYTRMGVIDSQGQLLKEYCYDIQSNVAQTPRRFRNLMCVDHRRHSAIEIFGLMRREMMLKIPPQGLYARGDSVYLARVSLFGRFYEVPEVLFFNRDHGERSSRLPSNTIRSYTRMAAWLGVGPLPPTEWWDSSKRGKLTFPEWNLIREYWRSVRLAPLSLRDRMACYLAVGYWLIGHGPKLLRDVLIAAELVLRKFFLGSNTWQASGEVSKGSV